MRAVTFHGSGKPLLVQDVGVPEIKDHELLIKVRACGICGSDLHAAQHGLVPDNGVMGHEFSGEIAAIGSGVEAGWNLGDRVFCAPVITCGRCKSCLQGHDEKCTHARFIGALSDDDLPGAYAQFVKVGYRDTIRLPDGLGFELAALTEPLATGLSAYRRAQVEPQESILILGAGPIGLAIALWANFFGVRHVVVSEPNDERRARATEMGATATLDPKSQNVAEAAADFIGQPPEIIIEAVGLEGMIQQCIDISTVGARIVVAGVCMTPDTISPMDCWAKDLRLIFVRDYSLADCRFAIELISEGRLEPSAMITSSIDLNQLPDTFESLKSATSQCKVIVRPNG